MSIDYLFSLRDLELDRAFVFLHGLNLEQRGAYFTLARLYVDRGDLPHNYDLIQAHLGTKERRARRVVSELVARGKIRIVGHNIEVLGPLS